MFVYNVFLPLIKWKPLWLKPITYKSVLQCPAQLFFPVKWGLFINIFQHLFLIHILKFFKLLQHLRLLFPPLFLLLFLSCLPHPLASFIHLFIYLFFILIYERLLTNYTVCLRPILYSNLLYERYMKYWWELLGHTRFLFTVNLSFFINIMSTDPPLSFVFLYIYTL